MGKRPADLIFSNTPTPPPEDPRDQEWYRFAGEIDDLLATGSYTWAQDALEEIQATVEKLQRVSEGQRRAVKNIELGRQERRLPSERGGSRRYEGWGR